MSAETANSTISLPSVQAQVEQSRHAQGLPSKVTDPTALRRIARMINAGSVRTSNMAKSGVDTATETRQLIKVENE